MLYSMSHVQSMTNDQSWYRIKKLTLYYDQLEIENAILIKGINRAKYRAQEFSRVSRSFISNPNKPTICRIGKMLGSIVTSQSNEEIVGSYPIINNFYYLSSTPNVYGISLLYLIYPFNNGEPISISIPYISYYTIYDAIEQASKLFTLHCINPYGGGVFCGITVNDIKKNKRIFTKLR